MVNIHKKSYILILVDFISVKRGILITQSFICNTKDGYNLPRLPLFIPGIPFLMPTGILHLGGGDLGLSTSIRSVHPVVN